MAADENILSWNFANWVTVVLMAAIAFFILGIVQKFAQSRLTANGGASVATG